MQGGFDVVGSSYNRATQAMRQPGSAFKPLVYAAGHEHTLQVFDGNTALNLLVSGTGVAGHVHFVGALSHGSPHLPGRTCRRGPASTVSSRPRDPPSATTGIWPQSLSSMSLATSCSDVLGVQHTGLGVMIDCTDMGRSPGG